MLGPRIILMLQVCMLLTSPIIARKIDEFNRQENYEKKAFCDQK